MMTTMIMMTVMTTMMTEMMMMIRYELPPPPPGKMTDLQAWTECVENSEAQLEHQRTRIMNLDLMLDYGGESWKQYNDVLQVNIMHILVKTQEGMVSGTFLAHFVSKFSTFRDWTYV